MRLRLSLLALTLLLSIPCAAQLSPRENFVVTDKEAYGLMPASLVAAPVVKQFEWSPDGQYVLAVRESIRLKSEDVQKLMQAGPRNETPPGELQLIVWSAKTQASQVVWKAELGAGIEAFHWLPKSDTAFVTIHRVERHDPTKPPEHHRYLARVSLSAATIRQVAELPDDGAWMTVYTSPVQPLAIVHKRTTIPSPMPQADGTVKPGVRAADEVFALRSNGAVSSAIPIPEQVDGSRFALVRVEWSRDGFTAYLGAVDREATTAYNKKNAQKRTLWRWLSVNPATGRIQTLASDPQIWQAGPPSAPFELTKSMANAAGTKKQIPLLWLEAKEPSLYQRALVASGANRGALSPTDDGVLYDMQGAAWVSPILRVDKAMFEAALQAAARMEALSNAKQLGLAALMRAQDYDETLSGPDGINDKLTPYLKNSDLFNGFVYTFGGGPLSGVSKPAETELGYVTGPGGRAVIFVDGHVTWRPDQ